MEVTSDDSWQATSQSLSKVLSKFPQEVTKTRNFTSVLDLATSAVAATHLCQDLAKGRKLLLSLPEDSVGSHSTGHSTATAPLGHLDAIPISHTSTQKEHIWPLHTTLLYSLGRVSTQEVSQAKQQLQFTPPHSTAKPCSAPETANMGATDVNKHVRMRGQEESGVT